MAIEQITVPWIEGYNYGVGVDLLTGDPRQLVVDGEPRSVPDAHGMKTQFEISRIDSTEDLERHLGIDAAGHYGGRMFGTEGAVRLSWAKDRAVQTSVLFMVVKCTVTLEHRSIDEAVLTPEAKELVSDPQRFADRFGNTYVRGIKRGGLYVAVMQVDVYDDKTRDEISGELKGRNLVINAELQAKFDNVRSKHNAGVQFSVYSDGGPGALAIPDKTDPGELLKNLREWLHAFDIDKDNNARPYAVTLGPLWRVDGPPLPNPEEFKRVQEVLKDCSQQRSHTLDSINLFEFILAHQDSYEWSTGVASADTLVAAVNGLRQDLDLIEECMRAAVEQPAEAVIPEIFAQRMGTTYPAITTSPQAPQPKSASPVGTSAEPHVPAAEPSQQGHKPEGLDNERENTEAQERERKEELQHELEETEEQRKAQRRLERQEARAKRREEAQERERIEAEERAREDAEERERKAQRRLERQEARAKQREEAQERERIEAEERAREEAQEHERKEARERQRQEARARRREEAQQRELQKAEERALREVQNLKGPDEDDSGDANPLAVMDREADRVIRRWTFGSFAGNLLPPPLDLIAATSAFTAMGVKLADVYGVKMSKSELRQLVTAMASGLAAVAGASIAGTSLLKLIPGVSTGIALLVQPPIVAAVAYAVGFAFKSYYHARIEESRSLSPEDMKVLATEAFRDALVRKSQAATPPTVRDER